MDDPTAFAYVRIGECYEKLEAPGTAIEFYKKAVYEDPLLDKAWLLLTNLYCEAENYNKALYYINKALQIDDSNIMYWRKYAEINIKLNFFDETVKAFQKCIDLGDIDIEVYIALTDVLIYLGEFKNALKVLIKAKNTYKEFAELEYRLFGLFMIEGKEQYAFIHLKNALSIDCEGLSVIEDLFPSVSENEKVQRIISQFLCN